MSNTPTLERAKLLEAWMLYKFLLLQRASGAAEIKKEALWNACGFESTKACLHTHLQLKSEEKSESLGSDQVEAILEQPVTKEEFDALLTSASELTAQGDLISLKPVS